MTSGSVPPVGLVVASSSPPEQIGAFASLAEKLGFAELWIPEDYWYQGAIASLVRALAATERIPVGIGIMSAMVRHPAVAAMELASAARMFPGRVRPGIGLGAPPLVAKMGLAPVSQLAALRECIDILRTLLTGQECTAAGEFAAAGIKLQHPPDVVPPIYAGVGGPKMLRLSGEIADGTVISAMSSPAYVRWVTGHISQGLQRRAQPARVHRRPTFAMYCVDENPAKARAAVRPLVAHYLSVVSGKPLVTVNDFAPDVAEMRERGGAAAAALFEKEMPDTWLDDLTVSGDPQTCAKQINRLLEAGADPVVLMPTGHDDIDHVLRLTAEHVLPNVSDLRPGDLAAFPPLSGAAR